MTHTTYAGNRRIIDVDSHVIELDDFLWNAATASERGRLPKMADQKVLPVSEKGLARARELFARRHAEPATLAKFEENLTRVHPNGWGRLGAFDPAERSHALDLFGFELLWVLPTFAFHQVAHSKDSAVLALGARVLNRAMAGFCAEDDRLFAVGYLPLSVGPEEAGSIMDEGLAAGCYTFMVDTSEPDPAARSFTHPDFDPIWARFDAADVPFVVHVAVNGHYEAVPKSFRNNRRAEAQTAADAPSSPLDFVTINNSAEIFLSAMVFDDVFGRHPKLRCVSMEHGAFWVPSWLKAIDFAGAALPRGAQRDALPSQTVRERIRISPFAGESVGWIIENVGPELLVFASDFPHPEGTSDPIGKFEASMTACDESTMKAFYRGNMAAMMGLA
ncbi:MAG: amidohydrolase family protein [Myxococcota bacterium]